MLCVYFVSIFPFCCPFWPLVSNHHHYRSMCMGTSSASLLLLRLDFCRFLECLHFPYFSYYLSLRRVSAHRLFFTRSLLPSFHSQPPIHRHLNCFHYPFSFIHQRKASSPLASVASYTVPSVPFSSTSPYFQDEENYINQRFFHNSTCLRPGRSVSKTHRKHLNNILHAVLRHN